MFPLEEGTKVLALLIAAQLHCLHTLLLVLGRDMKCERRTPGPSNSRAPPQTLVALGEGVTGPWATS